MRRMEYLSALQVPNMPKYEFCSIFAARQIYSKVIRRRGFCYLSTGSWWEKPGPGTDCMDARSGHMTRGKAYGGVDRW